MRPGPVVASGLVAFVIGSYTWMLWDYRIERCLYSATDPVSGKILWLCYQGSHRWIPLPEGYDVIAEVRDKQGAVVDRRAVDNVDAVADIQDRFSNVRWSTTESAFVDNLGKQILDLRQDRT
jgi:hypothetical protein